MKKISYCLIAFVFLLSSSAFSQTETEDLSQLIEPDERNLVESAVEGMARSHRIRLGIFRLRPRVSFGTGYDTNSRYEEDDRENDFHFSVVPEVSVGVKLGRKVFVRLIEQLHLEYYAKVEERRDIYNATRGELLTGSSRMLVTVDGGYVSRDSPLDEELDVPVSLERTDGRVRVLYVLTSRMNLTPSFHVQQTDLGPDEVTPDIPDLISSRRSARFGMGAEYLLSSKLTLIASFGYNNSTALKSDTTANSWNLLGGVRLTQRKYVADAQLGFGEADSGDDQKRQRFLISASITYHLAGELGLTGFVNRYYSTSVFVEDAFRLTTQAGIRMRFPIYRRLFGYVGYSAGKNDYGNSRIEGQEIRTDTFQRADAGLGFRLFRYIALQGGVQYLKRESDIRGLTKERFDYRLGVSASYALQF